MEDKKITVVMSAYNHGKYVGKAIESVLNQTYQGFKFFVADDASQDDTVDVIMRYEDRIDEIHLFDVNSGGGRTVALLENVDTPYTALINSDDYWESEKLEKQIAYMEAHPDCTACFTWCNIRDEAGNLKGPQNFNAENRTREGWMYYFVMHGNCLAHPSILIKTDVYRHLQCDSNLGVMRQIPDWYMWIKLVQKHDIHIIEEPLTNFLEHSSGLSNNVSASGIENEIRAAMEMSHVFNWEMKNMDDDFFRRAFRSVMRNPNASTHEEIMCEKFFVLLSSPGMGIQDAAISFYFDIFYDKSMYFVMAEKYGYTDKDFYATNVSKGISEMFLKNYHAYEEVVKKSTGEKTLIREELQILETYSIYCGKLLGEQVIISDEIWDDFLDISAETVKIINKRVHDNSLDRIYKEMVFAQQRKEDLKKYVEECKKICDSYMLVIA